MSRFFRPENHTLGAIAVEPDASKVGRTSAGNGRPFWRAPIRARLVLSIGVVLFALSAWYHYAIYLPQQDQPHRLTILDDVFALGVALLVALAGLVLGRYMLRFFALGALSRLERGVLALGIGWGLLSFGVLALGLAHMLYLWALLAGVGLVLLLGSRDVQQVLAMPGKRELYHLLVKMRPAGLWEGSLAVLVFLEMGLIGTRALMLPYVPMGYDLYQYHWAVPELYLLHHQVYAFPGWAHANFPIQNDLLSLLALAVQAPVAALMIQMAFGLLCLLLLASVLYKYAGRSGAWLGIALYLGSPLLTGVLGTGYAEPALAYYAVASLVVVLAGLELQMRGAAVPWRLMLLGGIFAGLGLATKYTQGQMIIGMGMLILGAGILKMVRGLRQHQQKLFWPITREILFTGAIYASGAILPVVPWLIKDWVLLGNPIYPFIWGGPSWDAARTQVGMVTLGHFGPRGPLWLRVFSAFLSLFFDTGRIGEPFLLPPNYALLIVLLAPVFWLFGWRSQQKKQVVIGQQFSARHLAPWLLVAGVAYVLWVVSQAVVGRYAIAWVVLLIVPAAVVLIRVFRLLRRWPLLRGTSQGVVLFVLLVLGPIWTIQYWVSTNPLPLLLGTQSLHQWETQHIMEQDYWAMVDYVNTELPRDEKVLLVGQGTGLFLQGRDYIDDSGDDWIPYLEVEGHTNAGILKLLQQAGFHYLIYEERTLRFIVHSYDNAYLGSFLPSFRQFLADSLSEVWSYQNFHIYSIPS